MQSAIIIELIIQLANEHLAQLCSKERNHGAADDLHQKRYQQYCLA